MFNFAVLENSKQLYENAKNYFAKTDLTSCVIETSDRPYEEWKVNQFCTELELSLFRLNLKVERKPYVSLYTIENEMHLSYSDLVFTKCVNLNSGEVTFYQLSVYFTTNFDALKKEFLALEADLHES